MDADVESVKFGTVGIVGVEEWAADGFVPGSGLLGFAFGKADIAAASDYRSVEFGDPLALRKLGEMGLEVVLAPE